MGLPSNDCSMWLDFTWPQHTHILTTLHCTAPHVFRFEWRMSQLKAIERMLLESTDAMIEAFAKVSNRVLLY